MRLTSKEFGHNEAIPKKFTCQGEDVSPELTVENLPEGTKSLALIMEDPDAPGKTFDHWIVYDIPVDGKIAEGTSPGVEGVNDFGKTGYGGPCPPSGTHRYYFRLYALDDTLGLPEGLGKGDVQDAMEGHVLSETELIGLYEKA